MTAAAKTPYESSSYSYPHFTTEIWQRAERTARAVAKAKLSPNCLSAVDDVVQDAMCAFLREYTPDKGPRPEPLITTITKRRCADHFRNAWYRKQESNHAPDGDGVPPLLATGGNTLAGGVQARRTIVRSTVANAIAEHLDDNERQLYRLMFEEELSLRAAAESLGMSSSGVFGRWNKLKDKLSALEVLQLCREELRTLVRPMPGCADDETHTPLWSLERADAPDGIHVDIEGPPLVGWTLVCTDAAGNRHEARLSAYESSALASLRVSSRIVRIELTLPSPTPDEA